MARHRHQEFIRFLNAVEAAGPARKLVHVVLDNYGIHKRPRIMAWLERHKRWTFDVHPATIYRCIEMPVLKPRPTAL